MSNLFLSQASFLELKGVGNRKEVDAGTYLKSLRAHANQLASIGLKLAN